MRAKIYKGKCSGSVMIPPSKSVAHRAIICAGLASGKSVIRNIVYSDDIRRTIDALRSLGADITEKKDSLEIGGIGGIAAKNTNAGVIDCGESGSTLRFFIPIFSALGIKAEFSGAKRLFERPLTVYKRLFEENNIAFLEHESGVAVSRGLQSGEYTVEGNISSQFITGLMLALSMCNEKSVIKVVAPFESRSYVALTMEVMTSFNAKARFLDEWTIEIEGGRQFKPQQEYTVEGDYSQLGFFAVLGAINSKLECLGLNKASSQGDRQILQLLRQYGARVTEIDDGYAVFSDGGRLCGGTADIGDCPDLGPILMVLAMFAEGETVITNAHRLRIKESDRIASMQQELLKLSVDIHSTEDTVIIRGKREYSLPSEVMLDAHNDHRIAMSLAVAATRIDSGGVTISGAECVKKSYPDFFEVLKSVGIRVERE